MNILVKVRGRAGDSLTGRVEIVRARIWTKSTEN